MAPPRAPVLPSVFWGNGVPVEVPHTASVSVTAFEVHGVLKPQNAILSADVADRLPSKPLTSRNAPSTISAVPRTKMRGGIGPSNRTRCPAAGILNVEKRKMPSVITVVVPVSDSVDFTVKGDRGGFVLATPLVAM